MEFLIAMVFSVLVAGASQGTANMDDCEKFDFEPKSCQTSKILKDLDEKWEKKK